MPQTFCAACSAACRDRLADRDDLDPWLVSRHRALVIAAEAALNEVVGDTLLHLDLRADNLMLRKDGRLTVVDRSRAVRGAAWADPAVLAIEFIPSAAPEVKPTPGSPALRQITASAPI